MIRGEGISGSVIVIMLFSLCGHSNNKNRKQIIFYYVKGSGLRFSFQHQLKMFTLIVSSFISSHTDKYTKHKTY